MKPQTRTLSTRLDGEEAQRIDELAREVGTDRATLLKQLIRRGYAELQCERALEGYRRGHLSLSRAAELAGIRTRDLLSQLPDSGTELNYDLAELETDLNRKTDG